MKMAKATPADMQAAIELTAALASLENGTFHHIEGENEYFDASNPEHCQRAMAQILPLLKRGNLARVVWGMETLLDPLNKVVNPDKDFLDEYPSFQTRVQPWMQACFGEAISNDKVERNHRFLEEALELVQSTGCTQDEAHQLVDYVFSRPVGEPKQEVGGAMVTLAALCLAHKMDVHACGDAELERNNPATILKIRAKQAAKPKHGPLPE